jgi:YqjK-like protein
VKHRLTELAERRAQLTRKAAAQRMQLGQHLHAFESRFGVVDQGILKARSLLQKPVLLAGGTALAMFLGPVRALRLVGKAALMISAARRVLGFFR